MAKVKHYKGTLWEIKYKKKYCNNNLRNRSQNINIRVMDNYLSLIEKSENQHPRLGWIIGT